MKNSIISTGGNYSTARMLVDYTNNLYIPKGKTGKNTHTYIDDEKMVILVDYKGNYCEYDELSAIHLTPADFTLNMTKIYIDYLIFKSRNDSFRQERTD